MGGHQQTLHVYLILETERMVINLTRESDTNLNKQSKREWIPKEAAHAHCRTLKVSDIEGIKCRHRQNRKFVKSLLQKQLVTKTFLLSPNTPVNIPYPLCRRFDAYLLSTLRDTLESERSGTEEGGLDRTCTKNSALCNCWHTEE